VRRGRSLVQEQAFSQGLSLPPSGHTNLSLQPSLQFVQKMVEPIF
jgi:hypothetical protein